jgi:phospholipid/cholesterol/gamma-HCH transport system substrate-binding protein
MKMQREVKVGLLVVLAFVILGAAVFLVSERRNLFALKNRYYIQFETVLGLAPGSPAQLNGVTVGSVRKVVLPESVDEEFLTVWIDVDRRYGDRVREDSTARIKTLGLLGDKFIEISSGSPASPLIPSGGYIPAAPPTDVEKLLATGGDAVQNTVAISYSLRNILARMEAGEGILGELLTDSEAGRTAKQGLVAIMEAVRDITQQIQSGEGTLGQLIMDDGLAVELDAAVERFNRVVSSLEEGDGLVADLLHNEETRDRVQNLLLNLDKTTASLSATADQLSSGEGLLPAMLNDEEMASQMLGDLQQMLQNLNLVSEKLATGEGTLGRLIEDPQIYDALNDIVVGIEESKMLRWLIRNRQKSGIKVRYDEQTDQLEVESYEPGEGK